MKNALRYLVTRLMTIFTKFRIVKLHGLTVVAFLDKGFRGAKPRTVPINGTGAWVKVGKFAVGFLIIATFSFLFINYALAWTNPPASPPGGAGVLIHSNNNVGIGVTPTTRLDVDGQIRIRGGSPAAGRVLTSDAAGLATWTVPAGGLPTGTTGQTIRHDGAAWIANSFLLNTGTRIGINAASPGSRLVVVGEGTTSGTSALNVTNSGGISTLFVRDDGNVGIGTTVPEARLHVVGAGRFTGTITYTTTGAGDLGLQLLQTGDQTGNNLPMILWDNVDDPQVTKRHWVRQEGNVLAFRQTDSGTWNNIITSMAMDGVGNVGIGTTGPTTRLDVEGQIRIRGGSPAAGRVLTSDATGLATWAVPAGGLPSGTTGQTIRHDGTSWIANSFLTNTGTRIGINTATPGGRLSIVGEGTTSATFGLNVADSAGTSRFFVRDDGNVGIGTTTPTQRLQVGVAGDGSAIIANQYLHLSDISLKRDIRRIDGSLERIAQINGVSFNWKENGKASIGLIAQDVEKVFPEAVVDSGGAKSVNYSGLIAPLIEAIKEQQKQINDLELKIENLVRKNDL